LKRCAANSLGGHDKRDVNHKKMNHKSLIIAKRHLTIIIAKRHFKQKNVITKLATKIK
jgi:hypothetical protein